MSLVYSNGAPKPLYYPDGATLYLDWMNNTRFGNEPTISRNGEVLMLGPNGYQAFPANTLARIDGVGAQVAPARTNGVVDNTAAGADGPSLPPSWSVISAAGVTITLESKGEEDGLPYSDIRFAGTPTDTFQLIFTNGVTYRPNASEGQQWAASVFARLVDGSLDGITSVQLRSVAISTGGSFLSATNTDLYLLAPSLGVSRKVAVHIMPATTSSVDKRIQFRNTGAPVDFTIRVAGMQLELGSYASPPIITTGAAVSRPGDILSASVPDGGRAFVFEFDLLEPVASAPDVFRRILEFSNGVSQNAGYAVTLRPNDGFVLITSRMGGTVVGAQAVSPTAVSLGRNVIGGVCSNTLRQLFVGNTNGVSVTEPISVSGISKAGIGGNGLNSSQNTFMYPGRFTERPVTDFATPADAFAWAKSIAQGWAS